jgi:hypothetical protein
LFKIVLDIVRECGDLVLSSSEMTKSRLDIGLVEHVAILSLEELAGQQATLRVSLLVQLTKARLERDKGFSRG